VAGLRLGTVTNATTIGLELFVRDAGRNASGTVGRQTACEATAIHARRPGRSKMWDTDSRRLRHWYRPLVLAVMVVAAAMAMVPAAHAEPPTITREIRHAFSTVQHFDPIPECGFAGATEYTTGNDHLVIVDMGDSVHVTFGETFRILEVSDDPALGSFERKGTDALHFNLTKSGTEVFTESFHDFSPPDFRVDYYRTFVYANGDVRVDREIIRNPPPSC
jgi:hypothetical protein